MDNMFKLLGWWTGIFAVIFYVGDMLTAALLFVANTVFFLILGYLNLTERMYMYLFGAYLMVFMVGFSYYQPLYTYQVLATNKYIQKNSLSWLFFC